jgi:hypothetical protein
MSEANGALQTREPGFFHPAPEKTGVPHLRCTAPLRCALHRAGHEYGDRHPLHTS